MSIRDTREGDQLRVQVARGACGVERVLRWWLVRRGWRYDNKIHDKVGRLAVSHEKRHDMEGAALCHRTRHNMEVAS